MARLSRLLSAVSLGIAATAAVAAVSIATEYAPVHRSPTHRVESADNARVIVKFRARPAILSASSEKAGAASAGTGPQKAAVLGSRLGLALVDGRVLGERTQVVKASGMTSSALAASLRADGEVEWAEIDHRRYIQAAPVDDPLYPDGLVATTPASGQWYLHAPGLDSSGRNVVSGINIEPAWAVTRGSTAVVISDVDTGITQHPDLDSKMLPGYDFVGWGNGSKALAIANDGSLADADPSDPGDWVTAAENSQIVNGVKGPFWGCNDDDKGGAVGANSSWHGTQTAGLLGAATNNTSGMAGTGYDTQVIPARAMGKCGGYDADIIAAAEWAGGISVSGVPANLHPARVINMSLGGSGACTQAYIDALTALRNKGVVVVAAAGNDEGLAVTTPANCKPAAGDDQTPIVIAVAAVRHAGTKVGFSDIGPEVTIAAPGGNCVNTDSAAPCLYPMLTTVNSGTTTPVANGGTYTNAFGEVSLGTSFATPLVAGTVALMLSANPALTNADVVRILKATVRPFPTASDTTPQPARCTVPPAGSTTKQDECICTTGTCGAGMLDAGVAVARAYAEAGHASAGPVADITGTSSTLQVGATLTLDGTGSALGSGGAAISTYAWSLPDNDALVSLGSTSASRTTLNGLAVGTTHVMLEITDANGLTSQYTTAITVTAKPVATSGGGGGGAANPAWLAALALAGLLLRPRRRRA
jgi:serine protease